MDYSNALLLAHKQRDFVRQDSLLESIRKNAVDKHETINGLKESLIKMTAQPMRLPLTILLLIKDDEADKAIIDSFRKLFPLEYVLILSERPDKKDEISLLLWFIPTLRRLNYMELGDGLQRLYQQNPSSALIEMCNKAWNAPKQK